MRTAWFCRVLFCVAVVLVTVAAASGETKVVKTSAIGEMMPKVAESAPAPDVALETARLSLHKSVQQLDGWLARGGAQKHTGWRNWLDLAGLETQLAHIRPDPSVLSRQLQRFAGSVEGLEMPAAVAVRRDLQRYLVAAEYAAADPSTNLIQDRLVELSDLLQRTDHDPSGVHSARAGQLVAWLEALGGEGEVLAAAIRRHYCRTNAVGMGSARLVNVLMQRTVNDQRSFAETVLGSFTRGVAYTQAHVSFGFVPSPERATLELRLIGATNCPANVAETRRVSVYSTATTSLRAGKSVYLTAEGLELAPSAVVATTNMQINDIEAGRRLVERLAWRRAGRMVPDAEQLTSQRAQAEATTKLDREAQTALSGINGILREKIRAPLIRQNALPADWRFSTDQSHLHVALVQHSESQLAPATPAPVFPGGYDVAIGAHESMIINLTESMLAGATIRDEVWLELCKLLSSDEPRALWVHDRTPRWSVTLARERPLVPRFANGEAAFSLRFTDVRRGDQVFSHPVEVEAVFEAGKSADGPVLQRKGDLAIRFPTQPSLDSRSETEQFLRQKFNAVFPPTLIFYGLVPPEGGSLGKLKQLELAEFETKAGWMTLGYSLKDAE